VPHYFILKRITGQVSIFGQFFSGLLIPILHDVKIRT
jgi:hypothetical protein